MAGCNVIPTEQYKGRARRCVNDFPKAEIVEAFRSGRAEILAAKIPALPIGMLLTISELLKMLASNRAHGQRTYKN